MTISTETRLVTYTGNGATTEFDFAFHIPTGALVVTLYTIATGVESAALSDSLYSVTGLDDPNGGTVTYPLSGSPLASTHKINIKREVPLAQGLDLTNQSAYFPAELEEQLDLIVMMIQQHEEELGRAVKTTAGSGTDPDTLIDSLVVAAADAETAATAAEAAQAAAEIAQAAAEAAQGSMTPVEDQTVAAAAKTTPADTDLVPLVETTGPVLKKLTWANLKATLVATISTWTAKQTFQNAEFTTNAVDVSVGQIKFPGTQNPSSNVNTLDDYEEGTFTPAFSAAGCTFSYATQYGSYTKIGNRVFITIRLALNTSGNTLAGATLTLTGLPFANGESQAVLTQVNWSQSTTSYIDITAQVSSGASEFTFYGVTAATANKIGGSALNASAALHATNGSVFRISLSYLV